MAHSANRLAEKKAHSPSARPGDGGHIRDIVQTVKRDHRQRHQRQQGKGQRHADHDGFRQFFRFVGEAPRHLRHDILCREAECHDVEDRNHIQPVAVEQIADAGGLFQQRGNHQHRDHHHHADADKFLTAADRLQPRVEYPAAGTKNSTLPSAGEMPNRECSSLPLPVIYAVNAPTLLTQTERNIISAPKPPT